MKLLKRCRKNRCFRRTLIYFLTCCMIFFNIPLSVARAAPAMPEVQMGTIDAVGNTHVLGAESHLYTSDGTVIQWDGGFNIDAGESVQFHQYTDGVLSADSAVLNRILTGSQTLIDGMLQGNGRVFVVNPAGIIFGGGSSVNVAQLVASTLNISNTDFQAGHYEFSAVGESLGEVINNGTITTSEGAALIAKRVLNNGTIVSGAGGFVAMAAGDRVLLGEPGSNIIVEMDSVADGAGAVTNEGTIDAPAGEVVLAAGDIYSAAMNVSGGTGKVEQNGEIHVDAATGNAGSVTLTAADEVELGPDSLTTANADTAGDGGEILAYSPGTALFEEGATVEAKGGSEAGNGGFFELSGKEYVEVLGSINMSASAGQNGAFLLDPYNLTIVPGTGSSNLVGDDVYEPFEGHATLGIDTLEEYLVTADVTLSTFANFGEGPEDGGDIIFDGGELNSGYDPLTKEFTDSSLYVRAYDDIRFEEGSWINFQGNGDVELYAGVPWERGDLVLEGSGDGSVTSVDRGKTPNIWTRAGDVIIDASGGGIDLGSLQAGVPTTPGDDSGDTVFNLRPGELRLTTIEGGDITLEHLNVNGQRYGSVYVNSSGNLTINGDPSFGGAVQVRTNTTPGDSDSASFICLIAEKDVTITGEVHAYAKGTRESVAGVWIGAGTQTQEGGTPGTVTLNDMVTADASASGAVTSDATIRIYGSPIVWPTNESKYPEAKTQGSVSYSGIISGYRESSDPDPVYYQVDENGRVVKDENGDPVIVENPVPLLEKKLGIGYRAAIEIDTAKDGTCLECVNRVRLVLPVAFDDIWTDSKNVAEITITVLVDGTTHGEVGDQDGLGNPLEGGTVLLADNLTTKGTLTLINGDTEVAYTLPAGWEGDFLNGEYTDTFEYYAVDADEDISENTATVTITLINLYPDAVDDSYSNSHNLVLDEDGATGVILGVGTDTDGDNDPLTPALLSDGTYGVVDLDTDGSFTYTPDEELMRANTTLEDDTFTYEISDGFGGTDTATVTIDLTNQAPDAVLDNYTKSHNLVLDVDEATGVIMGLGTDTDPDNEGDPYDPDANPDGWVFQDDLHVETYTQPTYGEVSFDEETGAFTYTPDEDLMRANTTLEDDTFTYTISDGFGDTDTATVTIDLENLAPDAVADNYTRSHNLVLDVDEATGVILGLGTDTDPDNEGDPYHPDTNPDGWLFQDDLQIETHTEPSYGTVVFDEETGAFTYIPDESLMRANTTLEADTFTYTISDGFVGGTDTATVTINLTNTAPIAQPDSYDTGHNTTLDLTLPGSPADVITGVNPENRDYDPDNSIEGRVFDDTLTAFLPGGLSSGQTSAGGTLELNPDGTFSYTPPADFAGSDSVTYYVTDGYDNSIAVEVAIEVALPELPPPPLPDPIVWEVGGCPALMEWLADELGQAPDKVQSYGLSPVSESRNAVGTGTSIAYKGDIQFCLACSKLKKSNQVLSDPNDRGALSEVLVESGVTEGGPITDEMLLALAYNLAREGEPYESARRYALNIKNYLLTLTDELYLESDAAEAVARENYDLDELLNMEIQTLLTSITTRLDALGE